MSAGARAAARLTAERDLLARAVTDALYDAVPELAERYGPVGREKCLQDMHHNLEHLASAVELERPAMFADYTRWLDALLRARNVATDDVVRCLALTEAVVRARFAADEADATAVAVRAGLDALAEGAS